ncbi:hypothetical protein [Amycolatopsis suaedae]|uniref:hypothetical protein n=1 Tax=Amycolatopsis suaedae TaxID=2510978 RepID=UPI001F0F0613|nr:hypothetical protein [Amycolatopsis suaedae]
MTTSTVSTPAGQVARVRLARSVQRQGALVILVLAVVGSTFAFDSFGTAANLTNIALQASFLAVVALA